MEYDERYEDDEDLDSRLMNHTVAGTAHLKEVAEQMEREESGTSKEVLDDEHAGMVDDLVQEIMTEPTYSEAAVISLLEGLLATRNLTRAAVYRIIDDHYGVLRNRIADRAFALGLKMGRSKTGATEP